MVQMPRPNVFRDATAVLLVAVAYFAGTRIGFVLTPGDQPVAMFWPPNAILLAAFLVAPVRLWWWFLAALVPAHFLAQLPLGVPASTAFGWLIGNAGEALFGAALISRMGRRNAVFHSVRGVTRFLLFGFILAPLVTSFLDAAIVVGTNWGRDYWVAWILRLLSNMLAQLTIVPTIVVFGQRLMSWRISEPRPRVWLEAAGLGASVVLVSLFVFRAEPLSRTNVPALIYLPLPLLLWAAMRFGPGGLSASLLTIAVVSIESLMNGHGPFLSSSPAESVLSMQVFLCMIGVPLLLLAAVMMEQRLTERSLRLTSRKVIDAQERERQRIAQELHDDVAQTLTLAEIELDRMIAGERPQPPPAELNKVRDQLTAISQAIWELSHGLYPSNLEYLGLVHALKRMCTDLADETHIQLHCETADVPEPLPPDVSLCLYRVAQEALRNIVRHSHASHASVRLHGNHERLLLQIDDDGVGFNQSRVVSGLGFSSMRERLRAVHGGVDIDSAPDQGTRLEAWVLLRPTS
jgi:two-component system sensor histidine kinase UhpB